jgi:hypothetical protein
MSTGEFAQLPESGQEGVRATRHALDPRRSIRQPAQTGNVVAVPETSVAAWETAYRLYGEASAQSLRVPEGDPAAAGQMAATSSAVAAAWRRIATTGQLPWWSLAAVESAAQAFDAQARDWDTRAGRGDGSAVERRW